MSSWRPAVEVLDRRPARPPRRPPRVRHRRRRAAMRSAVRRRRGRRSPQCFVDAVGEHQHGVAAVEADRHRPVFAPSGIMPDAVPRRRPVRRGRSRAGRSAPGGLPRRGRSRRALRRGRRIRAHTTVTNWSMPLVVQHGVQRTEQRVRPPVEIRCGADALASAAGQCGRLDALAAHIAEGRAASRRRNRARRRSRRRCRDVRPRAGSARPAERPSISGRSGGRRLRCRTVAIRPRSSYSRAESSAIAARVAMRSATATSSSSKPRPCPRISSSAPSVVPRAVRPTPSSSAGHNVAASATSLEWGIIVAQVRLGGTAVHGDVHEFGSAGSKQPAQPEVFYGHPETTSWKPASSPPTTINTPGRPSGTTTMAQSASRG